MWKMWRIYIFLPNQLKSGRGRVVRKKGGGAAENAWGIGAHTGLQTEEGEMEKSSTSSTTSTSFLSLWLDKEE
jgi:hypothetical protein